MDKRAIESTALKCECKAEEIVLLPCSGASNCGQIANHAAVKLTQSGYGRMYCLAGIGAHNDGMIESARGAKRIVAMDGCQVACARKTVEHAGLRVTDWICVTDIGIDKVHEFRIHRRDIDLVALRTRESLANPLGAKGK